ncbi:MAG: DUF494 family protein [Pigmentiphaga sp.]
MFEILVYLFDNYHAPAACPEADVLAHRLSVAGFTHHDIDEALTWLSGLADSTRDCIEMADRVQPGGARIFADLEYQWLGSEAIGFLMFLESSGIITPVMREIIIDRSLDVGERPMGLDRLRIIVLIVLWSQEADIDNLILDHLLDEQLVRRLH